ncbi:MAG: glycosyltransferase [Candidatus Aenigmarchaeota archaeon]|nr:glycosyltransferase [Candidatus Aenigmarchaeota archaeon]
MISIVIPTYNSESTIREVLDSLLKQRKKFREKVEIIVIDDGSKDNTLRIVKNYPIKLVKQRHKGPAEARNLGWKKARGKIVIFLDSDCKVGKNWLKNILKPFENEKVAGVGVKYQTWNKNSWIARFVGYEIEQRHNKISEKTNFLASYSTAYRRDILEKLKGFDTSFKTASAEDNDLSYRIIKSGYHLIFLKNTYVWHKHPESLVEYFKKQFNHAFWRVLLYLRRPEFMKGDEYAGITTLIQPFLYILLPFSLLISKFLFLVFSFVLLIIHIPATVIPLKKKDYKVAILIAFLFFIRGFVWASGLLFGLLSFIRDKLV